MPHHSCVNEINISWLDNIYVTSRHLLSLISTIRIQIHITKTVSAKQYGIKMFILSISPTVIYNKLWKPASFITIPSQSLSPIDSKEPMCLFLPFQQWPFFLLHVPAFCFSPVHHHIWKILKLRILDHSPNRFIHGEMLESKGILWVRWSLTNEMPTQVALS